MRVVEKDIKEANKYRPTSSTEFAVQNTERKDFAVKFIPETCSCLDWQTYGVPCAHACWSIILEFFSLDA